MPFIEASDLNTISDEWRKYAIDEDGIDPELQVDEYWFAVLKTTEASGAKKYPTLDKVVKAALSLSHGNADSERGLSINKRMLGTERAQLSTTTINGLRACKDAVEIADNCSADVPITRLMISSCRNAHRAYMLKTKEDREKEDQKKRADQLENEAMLLAKKKKTNEMKSLAKKEDELVKAEQKNDEEYTCAKHMLKGANEYMSKSIASDNKLGMKAAETMVSDAEVRMAKAETERARISEKRKELFAKYKTFCKE